MKFTLKTGLMLALLPLLSSSSPMMASKKAFCCPVQRSVSLTTGTYSGKFSPVALSHKCAAVITNGTEGGLVSIFGFNDDCCTLSDQPKQAPFALFGFATAIAFSNNGKLLAVITNSNRLYVFHINNCCTYDPNAVQMIFLPSNELDPSGVSFSPNNKCLAVAFEVTNNIVVYPINSDCSVGPNPVGPSTPSGDFFPLSLAYSPDGKCLAVFNIGNYTIPGTTSSVSFFNVDENSCALTPVANSPFSTGVNNSTLFGSLVFSPSGKCLTVVTETDPASLPGFGALSVFKVKKCIPTLVQVTSSEGVSALGAAYSKDGRCLFVTNTGSNAINVFDVDKCCKLTPKNTFSVGAEIFPVDVKSKDNCLVTLQLNGVNPNNVLQELVSYKLTRCSPNTVGIGQQPKATNKDFERMKALLPSAHAKQRAAQLKEKKK